MDQEACGEWRRTTRQDAQTRHDQTRQLTDVPVRRRRAGLVGEPEVTHGDNVGVAKRRAVADFRTAACCDGELILAHAP